MDGMDYVLHNPEQSSQAQAPPPPPSCPYLNRQDIGSLSSPNRPPPFYDPVHVAPPHWFPPHSYQWSPHPGLELLPPSQQPHPRQLNPGLDPPYFGPPIGLPLPPMAGYPGGPPFNSFSGLTGPSSSYPPFNGQRMNGPPGNNAAPPLQSMPHMFTERPYGGPAQTRNANLPQSTAPPSHPHHPPIMAARDPAGQSHPHPPFPPSGPEMQNRPGTGNPTFSRPPNAGAATQFPAPGPPPGASPPYQLGGLRPYRAADPPPPPRKYHPFLNSRSSRISTTIPDPEVKRLTFFEAVPSSSSSTSAAPPALPVAPSSERRRPALSSRSSRRPFSRIERDGDEDIENVVLEQLLNARPGAIDEHQLRAAQYFRGSVSTKNVASQSAISSLQSVSISDLAENERSK
jgi:hypothetical protein